MKEKITSNTVDVPEPAPLIKTKPKGDLLCYRKSTNL